MSNKLPKVRKQDYIGVGIALGAGFGAAFGAAFQDVSVGLGIGIAVGLAIGSFMQARARRIEEKKDSKDDQEAT